MSRLRPLLRESSAEAGCVWLRMRVQVKLAYSMGAWTAQVAKLLHDSDMGCQAATLQSVS